MAAESVLNKTDRLLGKPIPDAFDECIANLKELGDFYLKEFKPYRFSGSATSDEENKMDDKLALIATKLRDIGAKLTQLKAAAAAAGGSRKRRATRKLRRRRRF